MFWNWYTINACFLSSSLRITSNGMFAGFCIAIMCLVVFLEFLRRVQRELARSTRKTISENEISERHPHHQLQSAQASEENALGKDVSVASCEIGNADNNAPIPPSTPLISTSLPLTLNLTNKRRFRKPDSRTILQQLIRSAIYTCEFAIGYTIMLVAMYYNGYTLICILIGAFVGSFVWGWDLTGDEG